MTKISTALTQKTSIFLQCAAWAQYGIRDHMLVRYHIYACQYPDGHACALDPLPLDK